MDNQPSYDVVVVGGGPAGMTTTLYATRLGHRTAFFETDGGRHAAVSHVHIYGVSEDVSGEALSDHAVAQLEEYGAEYYLDRVTDMQREVGGRGGSERKEGGREEDERETACGRFAVEAERTTVAAERVVLATGFTDVPPSIPDLREFTGCGLHYCLHCDGYLLGDASAYVLGHNDHAARAAMILLNFTADVDLLLDGHNLAWSDDVERQLRVHPVDREVVGALAAGEREQGESGQRGNDDHRDSDGRSEETWLRGLRFADGEREYRGGFAMYGTEYNTALAEELVCTLADDGAVAVDDSFETSVGGVYAVGDLTHGQNQTVIAMGDGARAEMAIHKDLSEYPRSPGEIVDEWAVPGAPADLRSRMRLVRERDVHPGLRKPEPRR